MNINNPQGVDEQIVQSDMVELLDNALKELEDKRFTLLVSITKSGAVKLDHAGFCSELELRGLESALPDLVEGIICDRCSDDEEER